MRGKRRREKRARRRYLRWWKRNSPRFAALREEKNIAVVPIVAYMFERNPALAEAVRSRLEAALSRATEAI